MISNYIDQHLQKELEIARVEFSDAQQKLRNAHRHIAEREAQLKGINIGESYFYDFDGYNNYDMNFKPIIKKFTVTSISRKKEGKDNYVVKIHGYLDDEKYAYMTLNLNQLLERLIENTNDNENKITD